MDFLFRGCCMETINRELKDYIEQQILPIYKNKSCPWHILTSLWLIVSHIRVICRDLSNKKQDKSTKKSVDIKITKKQPKRKTI